MEKNWYSISLTLNLMEGTMFIITKQAESGRWFYQLYSHFGGKLQGYSGALWPTKQHAKLAAANALDVTWVKPAKATGEA